MAMIEPFRGLRFNPKIASLSQVVSQPYDRIGPDLQERYYALHPHNIVRIIRGKERPTDQPERPAGPNVYTRARACYDLWSLEEVLVREPGPALYAYRQTFAVGAQTLTRQGVVAALELSAFDQGIVLPHERTHAGPKLDRLRLLRATETHWGQVFMLYPDPENRVNALLDRAIVGREPDMDAVELLEKDVRQQVWAITDPETVQAVQAEMAPKRNLIIADGHHRYETALNYQAEMRSERPHAPSSAAFNYVMVTLFSMQDPGLVILPTHREIFDWPQASGAQVVRRAAPHFEITSVPDLDACLAAMHENRSRHAFGLYAENGYHVLALKSPALIEQLIPGDRSPAWKSLDVSILHKVLLEQSIELPEERVDRQTNIRYHRDPLLAVENVRAGRGNLAFFLNPTRMDQVQACATQGEKMPQKSTDFYPKVISGLVMMPVQADEQTSEVSATQDIRGL